KGDLVISQIDVTMGAGCSYENLAFFSDGQPEQSPRNDALSRAIDDIQDCRTTTAKAVPIDNELFFVMAGMARTNWGTPTRRLLELQGDRLAEVCRVDDVPSYTPFP
ncbi:MAG: hypothetical protein ACYCZX_20145, partial [Rhodospirillaceae bacterium]